MQSTQYSQPSQSTHKNSHISLPTPPARLRTLPSQIRTPSLHLEVTQSNQVQSRLKITYSNRFQSRLHEEAYPLLEDSQHPERRYYASYPYQERLPVEAPGGKRLLSSNDPK